MTTRSFEWRDILALHRYRNKSVYLHSSLIFTRGSWLISGALLSSLTSSMGLYTAVSTDKQYGLLIGQILHMRGSQQAQLTFLAPEPALDVGSYSGLLDRLSGQAIGWGAMRLLADAIDDTPTFELLRQASFAIYARQRIWRLPNKDSLDGSEQAWRGARDIDLISVRSLYNDLVPGLVQQVEPFPAERLHGLVYRAEGEVMAYVELKFGSRGIWAQPFIHPDAKNVAERLFATLQNLPHRRSRPVYVCIRSYQSWLESTLDEVGAEPGERQAVMVKHLAPPQKAVRAFVLPALEGGQPEVTAPYSNVEMNNIPSGSPWSNK